MKNLIIFLLATVFLCSCGKTGEDNLEVPLVDDIYAEILPNIENSSPSPDLDMKDVKGLWSLVKKTEKSLGNLAVYICNGTPSQLTIGDQAVFKSYNSLPEQCSTELITFDYNNKNEQGSYDLETDFVFDGDAREYKLLIVDKNHVNLILKEGNPPWTNVLITYVFSK